ncbi:MAG: exonuclease, partial [Thermoplasmata archaeon]|nr:exonuclease [Thermoplasmata archaeon]
MLRSTFLHLTGIGPVTEAALWRRGIVDWTELTPDSTTGLLSAGPSGRHKREIASSESALADRRGVHFAERLPPGEHWRMYPEFRRETAFLDIETT